MRSLKLWNLSGIIAIIILGFALHYLFTWTGGSRIIGLFAPVNESVWEHLKLGYWSVVLFSIVEFIFVNHRANNYYFSKTIGVLALEITIIIVFYGYTYIVQKDILLIDIFSYFLGATLCQYLTYIFVRAKPFPVRVNRISLIIFISIGILFGLLTFYPPRLELFKDPNNKTFGITKAK
jgi:hypothetical protein